MAKGACELLGVAAAAVGLLAGFSSAPAAETTRPDLVVIMVDDMGFSDLGCFGGEIQTPNIDRLAKHGLRATRFYTHGKCEPSRTALLTGAYAHQPAENPKGFDLGRTLADAGYQTIMVGKNHHGPVDGFARRTTMDGGACNYFNPGLQRPGEPQPSSGPYSFLGPTHWTIDGKGFEAGQYQFPAGFYTTDFFTDKAVEYLKSSEEGRPLFLYVAYNAPHWPLQARDEDRLKYKGRYDAGWEKLREERFARQKQLGFFPADATLPAPTGKPTPWAQLSAEQQADYAARMEIYAAQIDRVDQGVGRVIGQLEQMGRLDNTLFIFLSDNGADDHDFTKRVSPDSVMGAVDTWFAYGDEWVTASNTPFRWHKRHMHNGGVTSPLIMSWPARMPGELKGKIIEATGHIMDLAPTLLDAAGQQAPAAAEGKSLLPVIDTGARPATHDYIALSWAKNHALMSGDWKIACVEGRRWELYDLKSDPFEQNDLSHVHPERVREMVTMFEGWANPRQGKFAVQSFPEAP